MDNPNYPNPFLFGDLQVFAAPKKGDQVFKNAVKCLIEDKNGRFVESVDSPSKQFEFAFPHQCFNESMDKIYGSLPRAKQWDYLWTQADGSENPEYPELDLIKLNAGSWRPASDDGVVGEVSGNYEDDFFDQVEAIKEKYSKPSKN